MRSRSLIWSFEYAIRGIVYAIRTQRNMRLHMAAALAVFIAALVFGIHGLQLIALVFAIGLVIVTELMNTAVEATVDLATDGIDPLAAIAKDVAAGAVLIASITALAVGYIVFFQPALGLAQGLLTHVRSSSATVTILALGITSVAVLVVKAAGGTDDKGARFLRGGWPSGHTAIAFATAAAIGYSLASAKAMVLSLFIASLVAQSRAESGAHSIPQIIAGGLLGFLLSTAAFQLFLR